MNTPLHEASQSVGEVIKPGKRSVSFVIPCLNEERSLQMVLNKIITLQNSIFRERDTEIVVSDNGSTDRSVQIALELGARVVNCEERGYGAALQFGILNASKEIIVFADADNTYDWIEAPKLVAEVEKGCDLAIGSRLKGKIQQGAMPFLHRYLGTPVLNYFINSLHGGNKNKISDCNSGFRAFAKENFLKWNIKSTGMEFASEMLVKALRSEAVIAETPISLNCSMENRTAHLKRWRDGMRHLLQILLEAPQFFFSNGVILFFASWVIMLASLAFNDPLQIGFTSFFGIHTMSISLLGSFFGLTIWSIGLFLSAKNESEVWVYEYLVGLSEDKLFWSSFSFLLFSFSMLTLIFISWTQDGFHFLTNVKHMIAFSAFISNGLLLFAHVITAHLIKRA